MREFRVFESKKGEAYDLILFLEIITRSLGVLVSYSAICMLEASRASTEPDDSQEEFYTKAVMSLSSFLYEMCISSLRLVHSGNDISVRILRRSALEASDYWIAIQNDPTLAQRYVESGDKFNDLWYEKLRSDKLTKLRKKSLAEFFAGDEQVVAEIAAFRDEGARDFSVAVHPSYEAGVMALLTERKFFPETPEWDFIDAWTHTR